MVGTIRSGDPRFGERE